MQPGPAGAQPRERRCGLGEAASLEIVMPALVQAAPGARYSDSKGTVLLSTPSTVILTECAPGPKSSGRSRTTA